MIKYYRKKLPYALLVSLTKGRANWNIIRENEYTAIPDKPIIFAVNHTNSFDIPVSLRATGRHSYILLGNQRLGFSDKLFFFLNGSVYVNRLDKADTKLVKKFLSNFLQKRRSIIWFPEGTWNMTESLLMLPIKWGIIEVAQKSNAQIVPVALDYDRETRTVWVRFGQPIGGQALQEKASAIRKLRDTMASLRWEIICKKPIIPRTDNNLRMLKAEMERAIKEYKPIQWEYEQRCIYHPTESAKTAFAHLSQLKPNVDNAFLLSKRSW